MEQMLEIRDKIIFIFKKFENIFLFAIKFFTGFFVFNLISGINLYNESIATKVTSSKVSSLIALSSIIFSLFFVFMPVSLSYTLMILILVAAISKSFEVAIIVFIFLMLVLFFYARIATKESLFIIFTIIAFYFKIPYLIPLIAGLYFGLTSIIPIAIGVFIFRNIPIIAEAIQINSSGSFSFTDVLAIPERIFTVFQFIKRGVFENQLWISEAIIFAMIIFLVFIISKMTFDYSKDIAILLGGMLNIIGFLLMIILLKLNISVLSVIIFTILSVGLALVIRFFDNILDFQKAENLQFEDGEFYYYVKVIPKIKSKLSLGKKEDKIKSMELKPDINIDENINNEKTNAAKKNLEILRNKLRKKANKTNSSKVVSEKIINDEIEMNEENND